MNKNETPRGTLKEEISVANAMNQARQPAWFGNASLTFYIDATSGMIGQATLAELPDGDIGDVKKLSGPIVTADADGCLLKRIAGHSRPALRFFVYAPVSGEYYFEAGPPPADDFPVFVHHGDAIIRFTSQTVQWGISRPIMVLEFARGWNEIVIAFSRAGEAGRDLGFQARFLTPDRRILNPACYSPVQPDGPPDIRAGLALAPLKALPALLAATVQSPVPLRPEPDIGSFTPALGVAIKSCGRFGFDKGDGALGDSMPAFGVIARPNSVGHPLNRKDMIWHLTVLPPGAGREDFRSVRNKYYEPADNEQIEVDWTGVLWKRSFLADKEFYTRKPGQSIHVSIRYSTLTPGFLLETDDAALRLGHLRSAGSFRQLLGEFNGRPEIRDLPSDGLWFDAARDGELTDNFLLLFNSGEFPEIPVLLVLEKKPRLIKAHCDEQGRLSALDIVGEDVFGWAVVECPFGFETFLPDELDAEWTTRALNQCRRRSKELMAYPVQAEEYFQLNKAAGHIEIVQRFRYRILTDQWQSKPVRVAPLPPPLGLCHEDGIKEVALDKDAVSLLYPTKYGPLYGVRNSEWSGYRLPLPPTRRRFMPTSPESNWIDEALEQDFDEYLDFHKQRKSMPNPGAYHRLIQYAIPLLLFNHLSAINRLKLEDILAENIRQVCSLSGEYSGPDGKQCRYWYRRTEPFSGVHYWMTYLHVTGYNALRDCSPRAIENSPQAFVEIDWGNGFSLYSMYLAGLLTGEWKTIENNWTCVRGAFDYFLHCQDWACLSSGLCENGITWGDGTNYGGYLGFARMSEMLQKEDCAALGHYALAKLGALRLAKFVAGKNYFPKYYRSPPYYIHKCFYAETDVSQQFTSCSAYLRKHYRYGGVYNLTTEGHYPECFEFYGRLLPKEVSRVWAAAEEAYGDLAGSLPGEDNYFSGSGNMLGEQELFSLLMLGICSGSMPKEKLLLTLETAAKNRRLSRETLGSHLSHRRIPREWTHSFLFSQLIGRAGPALTAWKGVHVERFEFRRENKKLGLLLDVKEKGAFLEFIGVTPARILLDGRSLSGISQPEGGDGELLRIPLPAGGRALEIEIK